MSSSEKPTKTYKLSDGKAIPAVGLGTWQSSPEEVYNAVLSALKYGYRHIDTAWAYGNEKSVGKAIKDSGIPREELYITTKLAPIQQVNAAQAIDESLKNLGLDYVDLYLMHWPAALNPENKNHPTVPTLPNGKRDILLDWDFVAGYDELQKIHDLGQAKSIGVSNFSVTNLKRLLSDPRTKIRPAVNQVELHPLLPQSKLLEFAKSEGIILEAYSPLGSSDAPLLSDEVIVELHKKYDIPPANILISWAVWRGTSVLPKSVTQGRIESNFHIVDLKNEDGERINDIHKKKGTKRFVLPDWSPLVVFDSDE